MKEALYYLVDPPQKEENTENSYVSVNIDTEILRPKAKSVCTYIYL